MSPLLVKMFVEQARRHHWMVVTAKRAGIPSLATFAAESRDHCMASARRLRE